MAIQELTADGSSKPAIVRDIDWALAEAYGIENLDEALKVIAEQARVMVGAHQAALSYVPDGDFKHAVHSIALSDKYARYRSYDVMPTGAGIWTLIFEHQGSVCMTQEELTRHPRWKNFSGLRDARGLEHPPMRGWLAVPILTRRGEFVGFLQLSDKYDGDFTQDDLALLSHLAKLIAPTLELQLANTELQQRTEALAAERQTAVALANRADAARAQAEQIEERLNLALKAAQVGTWTWNVIDNVILWDDYIHPLFGLRPGTFSGGYNDFLELVHPEDQQRVDREVARTIDDNAKYDTEFQVVWPDGSVHVIAARGKVYRSGTGRALRMTGVCWDVTMRKRYQEALAQQTQELARSNAELEQFAYVASHDLQEPLRAVTGYCQLLQRRYDERLNDEARGFLRHIVDGGERMQSLIAGLLEFSRIGTGGETTAVVDAGQSVASALKNVQTAVSETHAKVHCEPLPKVRADASQLTRLFQNLIGNALKYHGTAAPEIHIAAESRGQEWVFSVRDNGIGFDPKYAQRIFAIFQRLHNRREYPGTGIGLALCERIVQRHGGRIWAESMPGQGSTFFFTLPSMTGACT